MKNPFEPALVGSILYKAGRDSRNISSPLSDLTLDELYEKLTRDEVQIIKTLLSLRPADFGVKSPFITLDGPPEDLITIEGQSVIRNDQTVTIAVQQLPKPVWRAFSSMRQAIQVEIGSRLMVESGYRSPAHQAITFLTHLEQFNFDIAYVAKGVALPGYSQHGDPVNTALDVVNHDGIPTDEEPWLFALTKEFEWLQQSAATYGFHLSYPENNSEGIHFEPWHWRYKVKKGA